MKADDPLWGQSKTNVVEFEIEVQFCRDAEVTTMIGGMGRWASLVYASWLRSRVKLGGMGFKQIFGDQLMSS